MAGANNRRRGADWGWVAGYEAARSYQAEYGNLRVPSGYVHNGFKLGWWVINRRRDRRLGRLAPERVELLAELGMVWSARPSFEQVWEAGVAACRSFYRREGHLLVPAGHLEGGFPLSQWLNNQRRKRRAGKLLPDQVDVLDSMGFGWTRSRGRPRKN